MSKLPGALYLGFLEKENPQIAQMNADLYGIIGENLRNLRLTPLSCLRKAS
jgi:hypothetical protein